MYVDMFGFKVFVGGCVRLTWHWEHSVCTCSRPGSLCSILSGTHPSRPALVVNTGTPLSPSNAASTSPHPQHYCYRHHSLLLLHLLPHCHHHLHRPHRLRLLCRFHHHYRCRGVNAVLELLEKARQPRSWIQEQRQPQNLDLGQGEGRRLAPEGGKPVWLQCGWGTGDSRRGSIALAWTNRSSSVHKINTVDNVIRTGENKTRIFK